MLNGCSLKAPPAKRHGSRRIRHEVRWLSRINYEGSQSAQATRLSDKRRQQRVRKTRPACTVRILPQRFTRWYWRMLATRKDALGPSSIKHYGSSFTSYGHILQHQLIQHFLTLSMPLSRQNWDYPHLTEIFPTSLNSQHALRYWLTTSHNWTTQPNSNCSSRACVVVHHNPFKECLLRPKSAESPWTFSKRTAMTKLPWGTSSSPSWLSFQHAMRKAVTFLSSAIPACSSWFDCSATAAMIKGNCPWRTNFLHVLKVPSMIETQIATRSRQVNFFVSYGYCHQKRLHSLRNRVPRTQQTAESKPTDYGFHSTARSVSHP